MWTKVNTTASLWERLTGEEGGKVVRTRSVDAEYEEVETRTPKKNVKKNNKQLQTQARNLVQKRRVLTERLNRLEADRKDKRAIASVKKEIKGLDSRIASLMSQVQR